MRKLLDVVIIVGFLIVDFFFFHDIFKPEAISLPQYLTGILSIPVIILSVRSLMKR